ncbi:MAG: hypothetical protein WD048_08875 [Chitinophagales bacterium]
MSLQYVIDSKGNKTGVFIPIKKWEKLKKAFKELQKEPVSETSEEEISEGLKDALNQVKLHQQGKIKLKSAKELLDEL